MMEAKLTTGLSWVLVLVGILLLVSMREAGLLLVVAPAAAILAYGFRRIADARSGLK